MMHVEMMQFMYKYGRLAVRGLSSVDKNVTRIRLSV